MKSSAPSLLPKYLISSFPMYICHTFSILQGPVCGSSLCTNRSVPLASASAVALRESPFNISKKEEGRVARSTSHAFSKIAVLPALCPWHSLQQAGFPETPAISCGRCQGGWRVSGQAICLPAAGGCHVTLDGVTITPCVSETAYALQSTSSYTVRLIRLDHTTTCVVGVAVTRSCTFCQ